jgi:nucleoside-diphosphate-sugar epimerase
MITVKNLQTVSTDTFMRVVITGAAGQIGQKLIEHLSGRHELRLIDRVPVPGKRSVVADLAGNHGVFGKTSWRFWRRPWMSSFERADVVLHLAGDVRNYASWDRVLRDNIQVTWNVIEAAVKHRVPRVVFASSNWAVKALERQLAPACYAQNGPKIGSDISPCPLSPYGISKASGELMGRMFVEQQELDSFIAVRIGSYHPQPPDSESIRLWIGPRDLCSLMRRCVEVETRGFHIVYGVSAQPIAPYDLSYTTRLLSWTPEQTP